MKFTSDNFRDWKKERVILGLEKGISWNDGHDWAPAMLEVERAGRYEYFYYYTAS